MDALHLACSEADVPVSPSELNANAWLLNCENGTVDLRTGELLSPSELNANAWLLNARTGQLTCGLENFSGTSLRTS